MITQELINYVKTQVSNGILREKITSDLLDQEWAMEQINEAFRHVEQSIPTQISRQAMVSDMTQTPMTIKYFEWLMYASFVASIGAWIFQFSPIEFQGYMITAVAVPIIVILLKFFCVYKVAYHRAEWARIVLVVLLALSAIFNTNSNFGLFFFGLSNPRFYIVTLSIILEIAAIYFVFQTPSNTWLRSHTSTRWPSTHIANNKKWPKVIPRLNNGFLVISALLVFGIDLPILIMNLELAPFFFVMLCVLAIFVVFYLYENRKLKQKFSNSDSKLDSWFVVLVFIRNVVFVLNFIPLIQILGGLVLIYCGIPYLIIYYFWIRNRAKLVATD